MVGKGETWQKPPLLLSFWFNLFTEHNLPLESNRGLALNPQNSILKCLKGSLVCKVCFNLLLCELSAVT